MDSSRRVYLEDLPAFRTQQFRCSNECVYVDSQWELMKRCSIASFPSRPHTCSIQHLQLTCFEEPGYSLFFCCLFSVLISTCDTEWGIISAVSARMRSSSLFARLGFSSTLLTLAYVFPHWDVGKKDAQYCMLSDMIRKA